MVGNDFYDFKKAKKDRVQNHIVLSGKNWKLQNAQSKARFLFLAD